LSEYALPIACALARRAGATLRLVHVHRATPDPILVDGLPVVDEQLHSRAREHERQYLERTRDGIIAEQKLSVTVAVRDPASEIGHDATIADALAAEAAEGNADLIVMTTHGRGGLARFWLGSVASALVAVSPVPLLLLRPDGSSRAMPPGALFRRVLVPLDGSRDAEAILEHAVAIGHLAPAEYVLLRVLQPASSFGITRFSQPADLDSERTRRLQADVQRYLEELARLLRQGGCAVRTRVYIADQPAMAILDAARGEGADLIALTTHGRGGMARVLLGSVADKVVRGAETPVLIYRPPVA
jgi:nucleotide-binding universal stress UspA family protein